MQRSDGFTLAEALVVLAIVSAAVAMALPAAAALRAAGRTEAAARNLAVELSALRFKAIARHRSTGLLFEEQAGRWLWWEVEDGNGNGLRTAEIRSGTDPVLSGPHRLAERVEHVSLGFPPGGPFPQIPPERGTIGDASDPVQFGRADIISFSPVGAASSGTLYVTDGVAALAAVRLHGPGCRVRVWRYDPREGRWTL